MYRWMLAILLLISFGASAMVQDATDNGEAKFVRLTRQLEDSPLSDSDKSIRSWLLQWAIDSPDITVQACDVMDFLSDKGTPNGGIYTTQIIFGNAAYQISNPDKRQDLLGTQLAGVRSALKAYQSILAKDPKAEISHFNELLNLDKAGTLGDYLVPVINKKCKDPGGA